MGWQSSVTHTKLRYPLLLLVRCPATAHGAVLAYGSVFVVDSAHVVLRLGGYYAMSALSEGAKGDLCALAYEPVSFLMLSLKRRVLSGKDERLICIL